MAKDKFSRNITMHCPTCGGTLFEFAEDGGPIRCKGCDRSFAREDFVRENGCQLDDEVEAIGKQAVHHAREHLRKAFSGLEHIKIK